MEGRPKMGVWFPCRSRGADSHSGVRRGDQASADSPPRRGGRLGLAGGRWRRLRRRKRGRVVYRWGGVGPLLVLFFFRPLALATRHTRRGVGSYGRRRRRRGGRGRTTITRVEGTRALSKSTVGRPTSRRHSTQGHGAR